MTYHNYDYLVSATWPIGDSFCIHSSIACTDIYVGHVCEYVVTIVRCSQTQSQDHLWHSLQPSCRQCLSLMRETNFQKCEFLQSIWTTFVFTRYLMLASMKGAWANPATCSSIHRTLLTQYMRAVFSCPTHLTHWPILVPPVTKSWNHLPAQVYSTVGHIPHLNICWHDLTRPILYKAFNARWPIILASLIYYT